MGHSVTITTSTCRVASVAVLCNLIPQFFPQQQQSYLSTAPVQQPSYRRPLLDLIEISGPPEYVARIRKIVENHRKIFKNTIGKEPARIPPFDIDVAL